MANPISDNGSNILANNPSGSPIHISPENQFALSRIHQLAAMGFTPEMLGLTSADVLKDPAAAWRAMSPVMGAALAAQGGHAAQYQAPTQMASPVQALVQRLTQPQQPILPQQRIPQPGQMIPV